MEANFVKGPYLREGRTVYALVPLLPEDQNGTLQECNTFSCSVQGNNGKYAATEEQLETTAALFAAAPELLNALEDLLMFFLRPEETENDRFERIGDAFYADTRMLLPGKSEPIGAYYEGRNEERQERFDKWRAEKVEKARAVLAKARGEEA